MRDTALIGEERFLRITQDDTVCYGGDQAWFDFTVGKYGGCGTVAAANLTAYLAEHNPGLRCLYPYPNYHKKTYLNHMEQLYRYVRPWKVPFVRRDYPAKGTFGWTFGVWPASRFAGGVRRYAASCGRQLDSEVIHSWNSMDKLEAFIRRSLEHGCPVAMLIGREPRYEKERVERPDGTCWCQTHFSMHWVLITRMQEKGSEVSVKVSTWGGASWLSLNAWQQAGGIMPALVRFWQL